MAIKSAKPQDTYDHIFGSGFDQHSWWQRIRTIKGLDEEFNAADDWEVRVTVEDGDDGTVTKVVTHKEIMKAARAVVADNGPARRWGGTEKLGVGSSVVRECKNLVFRADDVDFDAPAADELLQVILLGEVVFG